MDATLTQILAALYQAHTLVDTLQKQLAQRDARIAELETVQKGAEDAPAT